VVCQGFLTIFSQFYFTKILKHKIVLGYYWINDEVILSRSFVVVLVVLLSFLSLAIFTVKAQEELPTLKIHLITPSNTTYNQNTILLNFSIQKLPQDNIDYTIDYTMQGENIQKQGTFFMGTPITNEMSFHKNFTELPDGTYTLTASAKYVNRIIWVYADKQTVNFTINTKTPTPSPTPTSTPMPLPPIRFYNPYLILFASTLLLIVLGILAYYKNYRK
jgi:hypothetical protein